LEKMGNEIMEEMKKDRQFRSEILEVEKELNDLSEKQSTDEKIVPKEAQSFDPNYVYNLWRKNQGKFEQGNIRQSAKIPPNIWNLSSDGSKFVDPIDGEQKTWKLG